MAQQIKDRVRETTITTGAGSLVLAGAAVGGYQAFSSVCANGDTVYYSISDPNGTKWEVGLGTWNTGGLLVRSAPSVLSGSSGAGVLVSFDTGIKDVALVVPAAQLVTPSASLVPSRVALTDSAGQITSNGAITTNAIPKSVASGASLSASLISDDGTTVTIGSTITGGVQFIGPDSEAGNVLFRIGALNRIGIGNDGVEAYAIRGVPDVAYGWTLAAAGVQGDLVAGFRYSLAQTPDALIAGLPATSNSLILCEWADRNFDFAHALATNPTLFVHSANQATTEWGSLSHNATDFLVAAGKGAVQLTGNAGNTDNTLVATIASNGNTNQINVYRRGSGLVLNVGSIGASAAGNVFIGAAGSDGPGVQFAKTDGFTIAGGIRYSHSQTPNTFQLMTSDLSNSVVMCEYADRAFDFAHALAVDPTLFIHGNSQSTTKWISMRYADSGGYGAIAVGSGDIRFEQAVVMLGTTTMSSNAGLFLGSTGNTSNYIGEQSAQTPDTSVLATGSVGNSWLICETADRTFDFAHALQTDPTLFIHSHNQNTTEWIGLNHDGTNALVTTGKGSIKFADKTFGTTPAILFEGGMAIHTQASPVMVIGSASLGYAQFASNEVKVASGGQYVWSSGTVFGAGPDTGLARKSAAVVRVSNGAAGDGTLYTGAGLISANAVAMGAVNTGFYVRSSAVLETVVAGTSYFGVDSAKVSVNSGEQYTWSSGSLTSSGSDTGFARQSAGVIRATDASTSIRGLMGGGAAVASATALPLPTGRVFHVTGTTNITSITSTNFGAGCVITLIFDGVLTFTDGSNLVLAGNFVTTADDTITLVYDGTNWYEMCRSVN